MEIKSTFGKLKNQYSWRIYIQINKRDGYRIARLNELTYKVI